MSQLRLGCHPSTILASLVWPPIQLLKHLLAILGFLDHHIDAPPHWFVKSLEFGFSMTCLILDIWHDFDLAWLDMLRHDLDLACDMFHLFQTEQPQVKLPPSESPIGHSPCRVPLHHHCHSGACSPWLALTLTLLKQLNEFKGNEWHGCVAGCSYRACLSRHWVWTWLLNIIIPELEAGAICWHQLSSLLPWTFKTKFCSISQWQWQWYSKVVLSSDSHNGRSVTEGQLGIWR